MNRSRPFKAFTALITVITFLTTSVVWAPDSLAAAQAIHVPAVSSIAPEVALPYQARLDPGIRFSIPQELGTLQYFKPGKGPMVVHLQTAHGHYQAQKQIQALLHHLDKQYGIKTLLVEGSAFKLQPEILNFFPKDPKLTQKANDALTKAALVKGPELYLLDKIGERVKDRQAEAYGIENLEAYRANGVAFVRILTEKKKTENFLAGMNEGIERLAAAYLNDALRGFLKRQESFEKNRMPLEAWLSCLKKEALRRLKLDLTQPGAQLDWPMLVRIFKVQELFAKFDQEAFVKEKKVFLKEIGKFLARNATDTSLNEIGSLLDSQPQSIQLPALETGLLFEDMVKALPRNFKYEAYPNICYFVGRLLLQSEIKAPELMQETERLSAKIADKLAQTKTEKDLVALLKDYRLLQKLFALELTPSDYDVIVGERKDLRPSSVIQRFAAIQKNGSVSRIKDVHFTHIAELSQLFDAAMRFYAGVKKRDGLMEQMIEQRLRETGADKVAVITGGFHSEPFKNYFSSKDYSYALISPRLTGSDEAGHQAYVENMLHFANRPEATDRKPKTQMDIGASVSQTSATRELEFLTDPKVLSGGTYGINAAVLRAEVRKIISAVAGRAKVRGLPADKGPLAAEGARQIKLSPENVQALNELRDMFLLAVMKMREDVGGALIPFTESLDRGFQNTTLGAILVIEAVKGKGFWVDQRFVKMLGSIAAELEDGARLIDRLLHGPLKISPQFDAALKEAERKSFSGVPGELSRLIRATEQRELLRRRYRGQVQETRTLLTVAQTKVEDVVRDLSSRSEVREIKSGVNEQGGEVASPRPKKDYFWIKAVLAFVAFEAAFFELSPKILDLSFFRNSLLSEEDSPLLILVGLNLFVLLLLIKIYRLLSGVLPGLLSYRQNKRVRKIVGQMELTQLYVARNMVMNVEKELSTGEKNAFGDLEKLFKKTGWNNIQALLIKAEVEPLIRERIGRLDAREKQREEDAYALGAARQGSLFEAPSSPSLSKENRFWKWTQIVLALISFEGLLFIVSSRFLDSSILNNALLSRNNGPFWTWIKLNLFILLVGVTAYRIFWEVLPNYRVYRQSKRIRKIVGRMELPQLYVARDMAMNVEKELSTGEKNAFGDLEKLFKKTGWNNIQVLLIKAETGPFIKERIELLEAQEKQREEEAYALETVQGRRSEARGTEKQPSMMRRNILIALPVLAAGLWGAACSSPFTPSKILYLTVSSSPELTPADLFDLPGKQNLIEIFNPGNATVKAVWSDRGMYFTFNTGSDGYVGAGLQLFMPGGNGWVDLSPKDLRFELYGRVPSDKIKMEVKDANGGIAVVYLTGISLAGGRVWQIPTAKLRDQGIDPTRGCFINFVAEGAKNWSGELYANYKSRAEVRATGAISPERVRKIVGQMGLPQLYVAREMIVKASAEKAALSTGESNALRSMEGLLGRVGWDDIKDLLIGAEAGPLIKERIERLEAQEKGREEEAYAREVAQGRRSEIRGTEKQFQKAIRALKPGWLDGAFVRASVERRVAAAKILGESGDPRAVSALSESLLTDKDEYVRRYVIEALGKLKDPKAVFVLSKALKDKKADIRRAAVIALGESGDLKAVPELIWALKNGNEGWQVRQSAVEALGKLRDPTSVPSLIEALTEKRGSVHESAVETLVAIGAPAVLLLIDSFQSNYTKQDPGFRAAIAGILGRIGDLRAFSVLFGALQDKDWLVQHSAIRALGDLKDPRAIPALSEALLKSEDAYVRGYAAEALGKIGGPEAVAVLIEAFSKERDGYVRTRTAQALAELERAEEVSALIRALKNKDKYVRQSAAVVLGYRGDPKAVPALREASKNDEDALVREYAAESLDRIVRGSGNRRSEIRGEILLVVAIGLLGIGSLAWQIWRVHRKLNRYPLAVKKVKAALDGYVRARFAESNRTLKPDQAGTYISEEPSFRISWRDIPRKKLERIEAAIREGNELRFHFDFEGPKEFWIVWETTEHVPYRNRRDGPEEMSIATVPETLGGSIDVIPEPLKQVPGIAASGGRSEIRSPGFLDATDRDINGIVGAVQEFLDTGGIGDAQHLRNLLRGPGTEEGLLSEVEGSWKIPNTRQRNLPEMATRRNKNTPKAFAAAKRSEIRDDQFVSVPDSDIGEILAQLEEIASGAFGDEETYDAEQAGNLAMELKTAPTQPNIDKALDFLNSRSEIRDGQAQDTRGMVPILEDAIRQSEREIAALQRNISNAKTPAAKMLVSGYEGSIQRTQQAIIFYQRELLTAVIPDLKEQAWFLAAASPQTLYDIYQTAQKALPSGGKVQPLDMLRFFYGIPSQDRDATMRIYGSFLAGRRSAIPALNDARRKASLEPLETLEAAREAFIRSYGPQYLGLIQMAYQFPREMVRKMLSSENIPAAEQGQLAGRVESSVKAKPSDRPKDLPSLFLAMFLKNLVTLRDKKNPSPKIEALFAEVGLLEAAYGFSLIPKTSTVARAEARWFEMEEDNHFPKPMIRWSEEEMRGFSPDIQDAIRYWMPVLYTFKAVDVERNERLREIHQANQRSYELPVAAHFLKKMALDLRDSKIDQLEPKDLRDVTAVLITAVERGRLIDRTGGNSRGLKRYDQLELLVNFPVLLRIVLKKLKKIYKAEARRARDLAIREKAERPPIKDILRSEVRNDAWNSKVSFKVEQVQGESGQGAMSRISLRSGSGAFAGSFDLPAVGETGKRTYGVNFLNGKENVEIAQFTIVLDTQGILRGFKGSKITSGFAKRTPLSSLSKQPGEEAPIMRRFEAIQKSLKTFLNDKIGQRWSAGLFLPVRWEVGEERSFAKPKISWLSEDFSGFSPEIVEAIKYWTPVLYTLQTADVEKVQKRRDALRWEQKTFELPVVAHLLKKMALELTDARIDALTEQDASWAEVVSALRTAVTDGRVIDRNRSQLGNSRGSEHYDQLELLVNSPDLLKVVLKKLKEVYLTENEAPRIRIERPRIAVPFGYRSESRSTDLKGVLTPERITLIEHFYFKLLPARLRELIEAAGGRGAVLEALRKIPGVVASDLAVDIPETDVLDGLFAPGASLTVSETVGKGLAVAKTVTPTVKDLGGKVFLGQDILARLMTENPRALFYLLRTYAVFSDQNGPPALLTVGSRQVLLKQIEDALVNKGSGLAGFETIGRTALLQALRQGKILEVIEPAQGTSETQIISELAVTTQGGIASLHLSADMLPSSLQGVHFAFGEKNVGARDLMVASVLAIVLKSAADLIRNVPDANIRAGLLRKFVAENLPGVNAQGRVNSFVITQITRLAQEFAARAYIATKA